MATTPDDGTRPMAPRGSARPGLAPVLHAGHENDWVRLGLAVAAMAAYVVSFLPPFAAGGAPLVELAATPVVVFAWLFGLRGGLVAGIVIVPFNAVLVALATGTATPPGPERWADLLPVVSIVVLGAVLGGLRDLADRARSEHAALLALEEAYADGEARFRILTERTADGVLTLDAGCRIVAANRAAGRLFGVPAPALVGRWLPSLVPEPVRARYHEALQNYLATVAAPGPACDLRIPASGPDSRELDVELALGAHHRLGERLFTGVVRAAPAEGSARSPDANDAARGSGRLDPDAPLADGTRVVLCVDPDPAATAVVRTAFEGRGDLALRTSADGEAGLDLARSAGPDLILLALDLPDIHGSEVLRRILDDPVLRHTPVVMLGEDAPGDRVRGLLTAGAAAYLDKPFTADALLRLVDDGTPSGLHA